MERLTFIALASAVAYFSTVDGQTNNIRDNLRPCYNVSALPGILTANERPPASLNIFLEIVRRLEDANPTKTVAELAVLIIQRLRQDGIIYTGKDIDLRFGLPFSPWGYEAIKGTLISQKFLQNNSLELYYGDLDPVEICAFHYMISSSINETVRGDESNTCRRSSRYTSRIRRSEDAELLDTFTPHTFKSDSNIGVPSQCPVELGVFYTNYGSIKGGQVLNGIATGLFRDENILGCDNRYASTVAGELVETALIQTRSKINIGASGGWNSTINPKYHFLEVNKNMDFTNAEMRGSLDGLYMALKMDSWRSSDIKISQMLDMYYSPQQKGIFDPSFKACNRNILYSEMTSTDKIRKETIALMDPLDESGSYPSTVSTNSYQEFANAAVDSFISSLASLNDLQCMDSTIQRVTSDLLIFLDSSWNYNTIQPLLSYILDNIDVNKFGSRYTLFGGYYVGNITSNGTRSLLDFHKLYNTTVHQNLKTDFNYAEVYRTIGSTSNAKLSNNTYAGGESTIALLLPKTIPDENQKSYLEQKKEFIRQFVPDLTVLVLGSGSQSDYDTILANPSKDFIPLTETTNEDTIKSVAATVVDRIKSVPRTIVNPSCGAAFSGSTSKFSLTDYVEPKGVNYFKIPPHYFYAGDVTRTLKITELSYGSITVCISREQSRPDNRTNECETVKSSVMTRDLSTYCGGSFSDCAPIYLSVTGNTTLTKCKDYSCRFPDNIKYTISLENVGCTSGTIRVVANILVISTMFVALSF